MTKEEVKQFELEKKREYVLANCGEYQRQNPTMLNTHPFSKDVWLIRPINLSSSKPTIGHEFEFGWLTYNGTAYNEFQTCDVLRAYDLIRQDEEHYKLIKPFVQCETIIPPEVSKFLTWCAGKT